MYLHDEIDRQGASDRNEFRATILELLKPGIDKVKIVVRLSRCVLSLFDGLWSSGAEARCQALFCKVTS